MRKRRLNEAQIALLGETLPCWDAEQIDRNQIKISLGGEVPCFQVSSKIQMMTESRATEFKELYTGTLCELYNLHTPYGGHIFETMMNVYVHKRKIWIDKFIELKKYVRTHNQYPDKNSGIISWLHDQQTV